MYEAAGSLQRTQTASQSRRAAPAGDLTVAGQPCAAVWMLIVASSEACIRHQSDEPPLSRMLLAAVLA